jgi:cytochrome c5
MRSWVRYAIALCACLVICFLSWPQGTQSPSQKPPSTAAATAKTQPPAMSEGEKRFRINCGRCHNPPEDISPREARAVVRHMRVRAMLSAEDEKYILEFLAP